MRSELHKALAAVDGQIQTRLPGAFLESIPGSLTTHLHFADPLSATIDLTEWDSTSEGETEDEDEHTEDVSTDSELLFLPGPVVSPSQEPQVVRVRSNSVRWKFFQLTGRSSDLSLHQPKSRVLTRWFHPLWTSYQTTGALSTVATELGYSRTGTSPRVITVFKH